MYYILTDCLLMLGHIVIVKINHGICAIDYNCLNLPSRVDFVDGSRITYTYDGGGRKLRIDHYINPLTASVPQLAGGTGTAGDGSLVQTWTGYCGNKVYENDTLKMSLFDGRTMPRRMPRRSHLHIITNWRRNYIV